MWLRLWSVLEPVCHERIVWCVRMGQGAGTSCWDARRLATSCQDIRRSAAGIWARVKHRVSPELLHVSAHFRDEVLWRGRVSLRKTWCLYYVTFLWYSTVSCIPHRFLPQLGILVWICIICMGSKWEGHLSIWWNWGRGWRRRRFGILQLGSPRNL